MTEIWHLNNAPIIEALIDIRVKLSPKFKAELFLKIKKMIGEGYTNWKEMVSEAKEIWGF